MTPKDKGDPKKPQGIQSSVQENPALAIDARRYLIRFCDFDGEDEIDHDLLMFLQDAFQAYLEGSAKSVDQALGLTRPMQGRPPADFSEYRSLATKVLEARVADSKCDHQTALAKVAKRHDCGVTKVGKAWTKHKESALYGIQFLRSISGQGQLTDEQWERVRKIYKNNPEILERWPRDGVY